jgi:hypothetical protein
MHTISSGGRGRWLGIPLVVPFWVVVLALAASGAGATLRVQSYNDPAGDPAKMTYVLNSPDWPPGSALETYPMPDGASRSFGPPPGTYTFQALPEAGWRVNAIVCDGPDVVAYDVPHGVVTINHGDTHETCAFTNGKVGAAPSSAVSPSPPPNELPSVLVPEEIELLGVQPGKGYIAVRLRLIRRSVIKLRLRRGERVIAKRRVIRDAGTREVRIGLRPRKIRKLQKRGLTRVRVELKAIVAELGGTTEVFRYGAIVPL